MQTESAAPVGVDGVKVESGAAPATAGTTEPEGTGASVSMEGLTDEQKYELEVAEYRRKMVVYEQEKAKYDAEMAVYNKKVKETHKQVAEKVSASNKLACRPLTEVPFASLKDAIERLLPYHIYEAPDEDEAHHGLVPPIVERRKRKDGEGGTDGGGGEEGKGRKADGDDDGRSRREGDDSAEDTTEEVEVCPARSRTQAWSELCAQYARDFKRELDDKRRRVDAFDAGTRSAAGGRRLGFGHGRRPRGSVRAEAGGGVRGGDVGVRGDETTARGAAGGGEAGRGGGETVQGRAAGSAGEQGASTAGFRRRGQVWGTGPVAAGRAYTIDERPSRRADREGGLIGRRSGATLTL